MVSGIVELAVITRSQTQGPTSSLAAVLVSHHWSWQGARGS